MWITETGYTTDGTVTARQQAEYLVRSIVDFQAQGVKKVFWFKYREDSPGGDNPYGITSQNGAVKPAYLAYATMAEHLQDATYVASAQVGTAVRADLYSATDGSTEVVLWGTAESGTLTIPAVGDMSAVDTMDNPTGQVTAAGLTLALSGDPVFSHGHQHAAGPAEDDAGEVRDQRHQPGRSRGEHGTRAEQRPA